MLESRSTLLRPYGAYRVALRRELEDMNTVLDIGCGAESPVGLIPERSFHITGIDVHESGLAANSTAGLADDHFCMDALDIVERFGSNSFDVVAALDVIEHMEKPDGFRLLNAMEVVARKKVIVFTPNGFLPQPQYDSNPAQVHRSGWHVNDFQLRGYRVLGMNGWRRLSTKIGEPRLRPKVLGWAATNVSQLVAGGRPSIAFQLFAVRDLIPESP